LLQLLQSQVGCSSSSSIASNNNNNAVLPNLTEWIASHSNHTITKSSSLQVSTTKPLMKVTMNGVCVGGDEDMTSFGGAVLYDNIGGDNDRSWIWIQLLQLMIVMVPFAGMCQQYRNK
jgi:hypothetical protein